MSFSFRPATPTSQDDFDILFEGATVGTFKWKRNHPKPEDKVAIVRNSEGEIFICKNEKEAMVWLIKQIHKDFKKDNTSTGYYTGYQGYN